MALLNYTTKIEAEKTISQISQILSKNGATAVLTQYDADGSVDSLSFKISVEGKDIGFQLPCNWRPVLAILERDQKVKQYFCTKESHQCRPLVAQMGWKYA